MDLIFRQDWFYRQIQGTIQMIARIVLNKSTTELVIENKFEDSEPEKIHEKIIGLININKFNDAEDILFDALDPDDKIYLEMALDFYGRLNQIDTDTLEANNFSRAEIEKGLSDVLKAYNVTLPL